MGEGYVSKRYKLRHTNKALPPRQGLNRIGSTIEFLFFALIINKDHKHSGHANKPYKEAAR